MRREKTFLKILGYLSILFFSFHASICYANDRTGDWNDNEISWQNYEQGLQLAQRTKKPAILIFYADWCPYCHKYSKVFKDRQIIALTKRFVMIRVNVDEHQSLSERYNIDGAYIPRTFALHPNGSVMNDIYTPKRHKYSVGYKAQKVLNFMQAALDKM